ncbi:unannotated protein [freshwater metagenome]|uniref:Unannotated protein n=1 Tax=freshwater metagenome TaxID=449393 RepID=A0A6J6IYM7_9ZZZZ
MACAPPTGAIRGLALVKAIPMQSESAASNT